MSNPGDASPPQKSRSPTYNPTTTIKSKFFIKSQSSQSNEDSFKHSKSYEPVSLLHLGSVCSQVNSAGRDKFSSFEDKVIEEEKIEDQQQGSEDSVDEPKRYIKRAPMYRRTEKAPQSSSGSSVSQLSKKRLPMNFKFASAGSQTSSAASPSPMIMPGYQTDSVLSSQQLQQKFGNQQIQESVELKKGSEKILELNEEDTKNQVSQHISTEQQAKDLSPNSQNESPSKLNNMFRSFRKMFHRKKQSNESSPKIQSNMEFQNQCQDIQLANVNELQSVQLFDRKRRNSNKKKFNTEIDSNKVRRSPMMKLSVLQIMKNLFTKNNKKQQIILDNEQRNLIYLSGVKKIRKAVIYIKIVKLMVIKFVFQYLTKEKIIR